MTAEQPRDSLAEQAAAWVPPWARSAPEKPAAPVDRTDSVRGEGPVEPEITPGDAVNGAQRADAAESANSTEPTATEPAPSPAEPVNSRQTIPETAKLEPTDPEPAAVEAPVTITQRCGSQPVLSDDDELRAALEAILLVVDEPVTEAVLARTLEQPIRRITPLLERIAREYTDTGRGFELRRAAGGWRLYTRPEYASYVERFVLDGQSVRLTQAALETLAVVAYKQPVTRSRISAIRGVNCDGVIRTLITRGLIEECGTEPASGAHLYRTTPLFLEKLGLDTLAELPPLAPFLPDDVEELTDAPR